MFDAALDDPIDFDAWRTVARRLRLAGVAPHDVAWRMADAPRPLFAEPFPDEVQGAALSIPKAFPDLARHLLMHRDDGRFDLLYRFLWRLKDAPRLLEIASDPDVARAHAMRKSVSEAIHKMHAFVRFRRVEDQPVETYVAWFEPPHRVALAGADFFVRRMANLRFSILTPDVSVHWDGEALSTSPGVDRAHAPAHDALEDHWRTYYASIFNPARLNPKVMTQHMARKYWRNLPEAELIPSLVGAAQGRTQAMVDADATDAPYRAKRVAASRPATEMLDAGATPESPDALAALLGGCRRCSLWRDATQAVAGVGPARARLMLVGEQPGDQEDLAGLPFVGPAGQVLNDALAAAGIDRREAYVTNAVKHFKFERRGKKRLHASPNTGEIDHCRWWLDHERRLVRPRLIVALGASAARAVFGRPISVLKTRGAPIPLRDGAVGFVTVHPSYLLRLPDGDNQRAEKAAFVRDLMAAKALADAA